MWRRLVQLPLQITFLDVTPGAEEKGEEGGLGIPDGTTSKPPRLILALFIHHQEKGEGALNPVVSWFSAKKETLIWVAQPMLALCPSVICNGHREL